MPIVASVFSWMRCLIAITSGIIILSGCGAIPAPAAGGQSLEERAAPTETALPPATNLPATVILPSATNLPATVILPSATPTPPAARPAPVPPREAVTAPVVPPQAAQQIGQRAADDLAKRLGVTAEAVEILSVQQQYKPNGRSDTPGTPDGWIVRLAVGADVYQYQIRSDGTARLLTK